jgi:hypothetical protein
VPFQAVDGCARPGPCGGIGFTQGLSGLKRAFEFPMLCSDGCREAACCWLRGQENPRRVGENAQLPVGISLAARNPSGMTSG